MHVKVTVGPPTSVAEVAAMLRVEYRVSLHVPRSSVGGVPTYTSDLGHATGLVAAWAAGLLAPKAPGRAPVGARIFVTARPLAYPQAGAEVVLDVTLVRRRPTATSPAMLAWERTKAGERTYQRALDLLRAPDDGAEPGRGRGPTT